MSFTEATFEQAVIELFEQMGYTHLYAPEWERDHESPLLDTVLLDSLSRINKKLPPEAIPVSYTHLDVYKRQAW